jgi:hypothetical protein
MDLDGGTDIDIDGNLTASGGGAISITSVKNTSIDAAVQTVNGEIDIDATATFSSRKPTLKTLRVKIVLSIIIIIKSGVFSLNRLKNIIIITYSNRQQILQEFSL